MIETSREKLIAFLNADFTPQKEFTKKNLAFSDPAVDLGEEWNTKMLIKGVPGKGYYGQVEVQYRRVSLTQLGDAVEIRQEEPFTIEQICIQLNGLMGAFLSPEDLEEVELPVLTVGQSAVVTLTAKGDSIGWADQVTITITFGKPYLRAVVPSRSLLNTRLPPGGRTDYPSAWALLFYTDFTSYRDALLIDPETKLYTDPDALQALTLRLGIPSWGVMGAGDFSTAEVPTSNQDFDRVVIQGFLGSWGMYGPIYFHYNLLDGEQ